MIKVIIERIVAEGLEVPYEKAVSELLNVMTRADGYISGESLVDVDHPDLLPVFLSEQGYCTSRLGIFKGFHRRPNGDIVENAAVDYIFYHRDILIGQRFVVREIETQSVRGNKRTRLPHMPAEDGPKCCMQKMGRRVVPLA